MFSETRNLDSETQEKTFPEQSNLETPLLDF
jgi:hypothetical protein